MKQFVIGNDIDRLYWDVYSKFGIPENLDDVEIISIQAYRSATPSLRVVIEYGIETGGNRISVMIPANNISKTGVYDLELIYTKPDASFPGGTRTHRVTSCNTFEVVQKSCQVVLPEDITVIEGIVGPLKGYSAYEVAVKNGYNGTEAEWLESLKLHFEDLTSDHIAQLRQPFVEAAEVAIDAADLAYAAYESAETAGEYAKAQGDLAKSARENIEEMSLLTSRKLSDVEYENIL